ncbi:hypothetical protein EDEG_02340 [Edhazardia aedis USNM 41457]|uniref:EF-hand domain-containing protein n=1 Tax=Edhazardia aedis (strain USNM 41457) TaxID=1003232 RepID=J9DPP9_EDHAE|nr:hypothetical protein EDEG_02340 [Edhazardia aedis USNM 41457]|eukprot:EJW03332.1 hypothetical protein EDEG_02340 [Edhazardia aedis USNM 41457]
MRQARRRSRQKSNIFEMLTNEQIVELREGFNFLDTNNDTYICKEDLTNFTMSIGNPFTPAEIDEMMNEVGDTNFNFMSFLTLIGEKLSQTDDENVILNALKLFDTEKSGFVSEAFLRKYLVSCGDKMTDSEVDLFFKGIVENDEIDCKKLTSIIKHGEVIIENKS